MTPWRQLATDFLLKDYPGKASDLVLGEGARPDEISALEQELGRTLPAEFHELYGEVNGIGIQENGAVSWFFQPLDLIPAFATEIVDWFSETHSTLVGKYVTFIDWGDGDACGYLFDSSGKSSGEIHVFEHEAYEFEPGQEVSEFLYPSDASILNFLTL